MATVLLVAVGLAGVVLWRQAAAPRAIPGPSAPALVPNPSAPLPPLVASLPPLAEAPSNSPDRTSEPEQTSALAAPPIEIGVPRPANLEAAPPEFPVFRPERPPLPPSREAASGSEAAPTPPPRPPAFAPSPALAPVAGYDRWTAVYDIWAHTVYLPNGARLEAHSGLGEMEDDPRYADQRDRGPTPPHLYDLTLRESLFHGVQALRLTPIGGGFSFNRVGLLAHPYMLGPNGDSNGCVSFKTYDVFLHAFMNGEVKRLAVVARWTGDLVRTSQFASLRPDR